MPARFFDFVLALPGWRQRRCVVLDDKGKECPLLVKHVLLSFRGIAERARRNNNAEFVLIDEQVYTLKWKKR
jgi:hypothetical protein